MVPLSTIFSLTEVSWARWRGATPELLFKGQQRWVGGQYLQSNIIIFFFFRMSLFFHTVYGRLGLFVSCFVHLLSVHVVAGTLGASGFDIKCFRHSSKKVQDGDAECLILNFYTITLLVMGGDRYFTVWGCLHWWQQSQDVEVISFLVFNLFHFCRRFIIGR